MGQQAVEDGLDLAGQVVQGAQGTGPQEEVEADGEDALLAPLQGIPQPLGVLVGHLPLGVGQPPTSCGQEPRGVELDHLVAQGADHGRAVQGVDVQADL